MAVPAPSAAALFYDPRCGPCTLFALVAEWTSGSRVRALPYDGKEAERDLGDLTEEDRFAYAHVVDANGRRSGASIMAPLVEHTLGPEAGHVLERAPALDQGLRWVYRRFWNYRRTHGCGALGRS